MHMRALKALLICVVALTAAGLAASACGGDDDDGGTSATSPAVTATPGSGPGTITLISTTISGQADKILLIFATPSGGSEQLARACVSITSDNFTVPATVMTDVPSGNDPCGGDTSDTSFDEGAYSITAGVYVGGQQTAEAETTLSVDVAGDVTAELNGAELSQ